MYKKALFLVFFLFIPSSFASSGDISVSANNFVEKAFESKDISISQILEKSKEEQDIDMVKEFISDFRIKRDLNEKLLEEVKSQISTIQKQLGENESQLSTLSGADSNIEIKKQIEDLQKEGQSLKKDIFFKENLIKDLKDSIDNYKLLEVKYENILSKYVDLQKEKQIRDIDEKNKKVLYLLALVALFFFLYLFKIFLKKNHIISHTKENFYAYYDLLYAIALIIAIITFLFYIFPQLYILLVFVSGSIIWANAILISSFVSSLIIFRKFVIGDVIGIDGKIGKIVKITPLHTIIKKINEYGILDEDEYSIPNINLIKDPVNVINDVQLKDHLFSIVLSLKGKQDIFQIIDEIKDNILLKRLSFHPQSINEYDEDTFKTKFEQIDAENIKVSFYWIGSDDLNRSIEKEILAYIQSKIFS